MNTQLPHQAKGLDRTVDVVRGCTCERLNHTTSRLTRPSKAAWAVLNPAYIRRSAYPSLCDSALLQSSSGVWNEAGGFHPFNPAPDEGHALCFGVSRFPQSRERRFSGWRPKLCWPYVTRACDKTHRPVKGAAYPETAKQQYRKD